MSLFEKISFLNNALNETYDLTGYNKPVGKLKNNNATHWAIRIMQGGVVVGIIVAIAACILGNYPLAFCGVALAAISALSWYWLRDLSLLEGLDTYINELVPIIKEISKFIRQQSINLKKEEKSTKLLQKQGEKLNSTVIEFGENVDKFEKIGKNENKILENLNQELKQRAKENQDLVRRLESLNQTLEEEKQQNLKIATIAQEMKSLNEKSQENQKKLTQENKILHEEIKILKSQTSLLGDIEKNISNDVKVLKKNTKKLTENEQLTEVNKKDKVVNKLIHMTEMVESFSINKVQTLKKNNN